MHEHSYANERTGQAVYCTVDAEAKKEPDEEPAIADKDSPRAGRPPTAMFPAAAGHAGGQWSADFVRKKLTSNGETMSNIAPKSHPASRLS